MSHVGQRKIMSTKDFILVYDIPSQNSAWRKRIVRKLKKFDAKRIQDSVWRSSNLKFLVSLASEIKLMNGKALILEEKFIFK